MLTDSTPSSCAIRGHKSTQKAKEKRKQVIKRFHDTYPASPPCTAVAFIPGSMLVEQRRPIDDEGKRLRGLARVLVEDHELLSVAAHVIKPS